MHIINAFLGKDEIINRFSSNWIETKKIKLPQGFSMFFLTDDLFDDITELANNNEPPEYGDYFSFLSSAIYELLIHESSSGKIAYFETEYFGGPGCQAAILFENGVAKIGPFKTETYWNEKNNSYSKRPEGESAINRVLKELGVYREKDMDEFDSIRLGNYRRMD